MENIYIEILSFGRENPGFRYIDLVEYLNSKNLKFENNNLPIRAHTAHLQYVLLNFFQELSGKPIESVDYANNTSVNCYLKPESLSYLLGYESLKQAEKDSKTATRWAILSFLVSALLALVSIIISIVKC